MSERMLGAQRMIDDLAAGLDAKIRNAAEQVLQCRRKADHTKEVFGPDHTVTTLALMDISFQRGVFRGLVESWELVTQLRYPVEEMEWD